MNNSPRRSRTKLDAASRPALSPHMKLRQDPTRDNWVVLGPERIVTPNEQAAEVLRLCDGKRTVAEIAMILAGSYDAAPAAIEADIVSLLQDLADSGVVRT
jgi:pyrroloquinoline quinone biosynthesis protein D